MKDCLHCGQVMTPKVWDTGTLETPTEFRRRMFCDRRCHAEHRKAESDSHAQQGECIWCGGPLIRKTHPSGWRESWARFSARLCCSKPCGHKYGQYTRKRNEGQFSDLVELEAAQ